MSKYKLSRRQIREHIKRQLNLITSDVNSAYEDGLYDGLVFAYHLLEKEKK